MKKFTKIIVTIMVIVLSCFALTACDNENDTTTNNDSSQETTNEKITYKIAVPDGAPALSVANIVNGSLKSELRENQNISLDIQKPNLIKTSVQGKKVDIAILPTNLAYNLYKASIKNNDSDPYIMIGTATYGNLYIVGKNAHANFQDLKGKTLYSIGRDMIPHKILEKVATANSLELNILNDNQTIASNKINVKFVADVFSAIEADKNAEVFGLLGEPAVTVAKAKKGLKPCFDMQALYKDATNSTATDYPQAIVIARKSFITKNNAFVTTFMKNMVANQTFIVENKADLTNILQNNTYGTKSTSGFPAPSIEKCAIKVKTASSAKEEVKTLLNNFDLTVEDGFFSDLTF